MNNVVFSSYINILTEASKDYLIDKLDPDYFSNEQKQVLKDFFAEGKGRDKKIPWERVNSKKNPLTWDDFLFVMATKALLTDPEELEGVNISEGIDYLDFPIPGGNGYVPLNHRASQILASDKIGECKAMWCSASQHDNNWTDHIVNKRQILIYILLTEDKRPTKWAILVDTDDSFEIRDRLNNFYRANTPEERGTAINEDIFYTETGISMTNDILSHQDILNKARNILHKGQ